MLETDCGCRMRRHLSKGCRIEASHGMFQHPSVIRGEFGETQKAQVAMYLARYVAHLASSNDRGVDSERLAALNAFVHAQGGDN